MRLCGADSSTTRSLAVCLAGLERDFELIGPNVANVPPLGIFFKKSTTNIRNVDALKRQKSEKNPLGRTFWRPFF